MAQQRAHGTRRVWLPAAFLGAFALVIVTRLVWVQVVKHAEYAAAAAAELTQDNTVYARRGTILDRNGNVLAASIDTWDVYVSARAWRETQRAEPGSKKIGDALHMDAAAVRALVQGKTGDVLIKRDVDFETGRQLEAEGLPGVVLLPNTMRVYPEGDVGASVLGFTGLDNTGLAGIEASYNGDLQGEPGKLIYERDTTGEPIPFGRHVAIEPKPGKDLVLTIDRFLQRRAEESLDAAIKQHRAQGGAIIMMDPMSGEILALATKPGLQYSTLDLSDPKQTELFRNRAVTDLYEPGSVMKIVTTAAAIDQGLVTPETTYVDNGYVQVYDRVIKNWDDSVYGLQSMTGVLQNSINTGAVFMAMKLGEEKFHRYTDAFGFGQPTGIDLMGEADGLVRKPGDESLDPPYSPVDLATQSFGQAISVTPIQMISAVATVINGGNVIKPHLLKATVDAEGHRTDVRPEILRRAISEQTSQTLKQMLNAVVDPVGRVHPGKPKDYTAGGKSGTANVPDRGYDDRQVASFVGFAPLDHPKVLIMVKLDQNADLMTGTMAAAPVFAALADETLHYLNELPDAKQVSR